MSLHLHIEALSAKDLQEQVAALAGVAGLTQYSDDGLLAELRQRMAAKGHVVKIGPFESDEADEPVTQPEKPAGAKPGRKPKADATTAPPIAPEPPKTVEPASDTAKAMNEAKPAPTIDDVKHALNAFAAVKGQMPARDKMQAVGGSVKLMDVPATKYAALIDALALPVAA